MGGDDNRVTSPFAANHHLNAGQSGVLKRGFGRREIRVHLREFGIRETLNRVSVDE